VSTRSKRDRRDSEQWYGNCELREVRAKERAKNWSVRVSESEGGNNLSEVERAGKKVRMNER
jgi:hypothetical protein